MSAKKAKKSAPPASTPAPVSAPASVAPAPAAAASSAHVAWIDSDDPKKRQWAKILLVVVWLYVAALFLLALDQTFKWGIFGP